jgi:hypothetical protein
LISCDHSVAVTISTCHLQELLVVSKALTILPTISALNIDPNIASSSVLFATTATAAANLSTDSEICPEDVERLLLHSLCILKLTRGGRSVSDKIIRVSNTGSEKLEKDKEKDKEKPLVDQLADSLPAFLISATNSLNANLSSLEMTPILQHCSAIVSELFTHYPSCALEIMKNPEKRLTANTAAIALAVKGLQGRGHVISKDEEAVMTRARPAVVALLKIIQSIERQERSYPLIAPISDGTSTHQLTAAQAILPVGTAISGKTHRSIDDSSAADEVSFRKKPKQSD